MSPRDSVTSVFSLVKGCVALFALLSGVAAQPATFWKDPQHLLLLGVERLAQGDSRESLPLLEASLRLAPDSQVTRAWLAAAFHLQRRLDEAAAHYERLLKAEPVQAIDASRREAILRFAPRVFQVPSDPFGLLDAVAIHHPEEPLIAYHLFWEDDIDFPSDNDPCDHELVWVRYDPVKLQITDFHTYFHGRILSSPAAVREAAEEGGRPRVNVQWGKHGSLPFGWEELQIQASDGDIERQYLDLERPATLKQYNAATYQKLHREGRQFADHPRTANWPVRFDGTWEEFVRFDKEIDIRPHFSRYGKMAVSRWNSAALQQRFLAYNFRPKTEWPDRSEAERSLQAQLDRRVGASGNALLTSSEALALRREAGAHADSLVARLAEKLPFELPAMSVFLPETPRYPNVWLYGPVERFATYESYVRFLAERLRHEGYDSGEVGLNEGADLALSIEHLQPWDAVEGLRHAHAVHLRLFWKRLERRSLHSVALKEGRFWRVAGSVHYEVEHAHPLHADVEVCPYCGRTGDYAPRPGSLVERVHDPLGLELLLDGKIRGRTVAMPNRKNVTGLRQLLRIPDSDLFLARPFRSDMNTEAIALVIVRAQ